MVQNVVRASYLGLGWEFLPLTVPGCNFVDPLTVRTLETWLAAVNNFFIGRRFSAEALCAVSENSICTSFSGNQLAS